MDKIAEIIGNILIITLLIWSAIMVSNGVQYYTKSEEPKLIISTIREHEVCEECLPCVYENLQALPSDIWYN